MAKDLISRFESFEITHVPQAKNSKVDRLAQIRSGIDKDPKCPVETLISSSACESLVNNVNEESTWMISIIKYLIDGELILDKIKARALKIKATHYVYKFG